MILPLPGDRLQEVVIEATEEDDHERYLSVFSVCGRLTRSISDMHSS